MDFGSEAMISSFDLLIQINNFREQETKRILNHGDLLKIIRSEFDEEIRFGKISNMVIVRELPNGGHRNDPYFELTISQAKQVLLKESKGR